MFDPLSLDKICICENEGTMDYHHLRIYTKIKKCLLLELNTKVGSLI